MLHFHFFSVNNTDVGMQQVIKTLPIHTVVKYIANCLHFSYIIQIYTKKTNQCTWIHLLYW